MSRGRSSTPWKRRAQPPGGVRPSSPVRPDREVSPLSDSESPTRVAKTAKAPDKADPKLEDTQAAGQKVAPPNRGRQPASVTPSAFAGSRSQSIASDTPTDKRKRGRAPYKIKAEPPSTPAAIPSDTEQQPQRATGRRGRPGRPTLGSKSDLVLTSTPANKRKRSPDLDSTTPPPAITRQPSSPATTRFQQPPSSRHFSLSLSNDPSLVVVTKNFGKTAQLLLNEINSHKLAGIFAKPLSERDAPGYKDLVRRPQDMKNIKAAISRGSKAASVAIEAFEERDGGQSSVEHDEGSGETPTRNGPVAATAVDPLSGERSLGNGVYVVRATEDLVPPKAIVNSGQLETELVRMFANAVMFNPLPSSERGFGHSLRLRKRGGDVGPQHKDDEDDEQLESSESDESTPSDVGGIISDTREMFEDVLAMVRKWREVELERLGSSGEVDHVSSTPVTGPSKFVSHGTGSGDGSIQVSANPSVRHSESMENEDEGGQNTPAASTAGTARKRRRLAA